MDDPNRTAPHLPATLDDESAVTPQRIARYRVERILGRGGFGLVYLAHDDQLQRPVAIKVPHASLTSRPEDAEAYLAEARTVANLYHPNIVPVYDVGSTEDCPCFVVSKFISGCTLAERITANRPSVPEAVQLVATVAETLHYAHRQGLVHRDIKPGNILLDASGKPFVADFGLALEEEKIGHGPKYAGTPEYMSPEQAKGEGHRVDGRSDIFSLGVVFHELLTGRRPFRAESQQELLEQITSMEVRPPRQWDDSIPIELERICLKALSKNLAERYATAKDMADELGLWLSRHGKGPDSSSAMVLGSARRRNMLPKLALVGIALFLMAVLALFAWLGEAPPPDGRGRELAEWAKTDRDRLQGVWNVIYQEQRGKKFVLRTKEQWTFSGDKVKGRTMGRDFVAAFRIDETQNPHFIDVAIEGGESSKGVYRIDGDSLTMSFGDSNIRPRQVVTDGYSSVGIMGYGFKRAKR